MLKVTQHEIIRDSSGDLKSLIIGVTYADAATQQQSYKEVLLPAKDFAGVPSKAEVIEKVTQWLTKVPTFEHMLPDGTIKIQSGKSVLQIMMEEAGKIPDTIVSLKEGIPESLIGETIIV